MKVICRVQENSVACYDEFTGSIRTGVCNMGVKIAEKNYTDAVNVIRRSGLPGCRIFMETLNADSSAYYEMNFQ